MFKKILCTFLGIFHLARYILIGFFLEHMYHEKFTYFIVYTIIYCLFYLIQVLLCIKRFSSLLLSIIGCIWFQVPYSIAAKKQKKQVVFLTVFEFLECIFSSYSMAYFLFQNRIIPLYLSISIYILSLLPTPLFYEGTLFRPSMAIHLSMYLLLALEHFLSTSMGSIFFSLHLFWIVFCFGAWRIITILEPYAFWSSLKTVYSPFRAMFECRFARSLIVIFILHVETFYITYVCWWFMKYLTLNIILITLFSFYYIVFFIYELFKFNTPFEHRIKPITVAQTTNPSPWIEHSFLYL